eukprot:g1232.t1
MKGRNEDDVAVETGAAEIDDGDIEGLIRKENRGSRGGGRGRRCSGEYAAWSAVLVLATAASIVAGRYQTLSSTQKKMPIFWGRLSAMIGWLYFFAWSVSFYPQVVLNFSRKSVEGLSFDYQALNLLGFACYAVFNIVTFFPTSIRDEYKIAHHGDTPDVEANDVFFAIHAVCLTCLTCAQIATYDRAGQRFSRWSIGLVVAFAVGIAVYAVICAFSDGSVEPKNVRSWLSWSTSLSVVKLIITCMKYVPQVYLNYQRRSTSGWAIGNVLLDISGGALSVAQQLMDCALSGEWSGISGDPVKFGLGFVSILFDIIFMIQHYVLYDDRSPVNFSLRRSENSSTSLEDPLVQRDSRALV